MEHITQSLRDIAPWVLTSAILMLCKMIRRFNKTFALTRFKADECHEELVERNPEYHRRLKTYMAHRKSF
jgi:hypothetical protein